MKFLELVAKSKKVAEVILYGSVSEWNALNAISIRKVIRDAEKAGYEQLTLRIVNNRGGSIFEGLAIYDALQETTLHTIARIESLAASMASAIAMGCDEVHMAKGARLMIHQSSGGAWGSASKLISTGKLLESLNDSLAEMYAEKTGKEKAWILDNWMAENTDTFFTAAKAKEANLIDEIFGNRVKPAKDSAEGSIDFTAMVAHYDAEIARVNPLDEVTNSNNNNSMFNFEKFPKLAALIGSENEITAEVITAVNEELTKQGLKGIVVASASAQEALTQQASTDADKVKTLTASLEAAMKKLDPEHTGEVTQDAIIGKIDGQTKSLRDAEAKVVELGGKPGAKHTAPPKPSGDNIDDQDDPNAEIAGLAHNKALDSNPLFN